MVAADEEDRVVGARAGEHRGKQHDRLVRHAQPEGAQAGDDALGGRQRHPDRDQRQHHGERIAIDHQQDRQQGDDGGDFDGDPVAIADVLNIVEGARGAGGVGLQGGSRHGVLDGLHGALGRGDRPGGGYLADNVDWQKPGLVVSADQDFLQRWRGDEILKCRDVLGFGTQFADQFAIDRLIGRGETLLIGQDDQQDVVRAGLLERLAHLLLAHHRGRVGRKDGGGRFLGEDAQRRKHQAQCRCQADPHRDDQPWPPHDDATDQTEDTSTWGGRVRLCRKAVSSHLSIVGDLR